MSLSDSPLIGIPCRGDESATYPKNPINAQNPSYSKAIIAAGGIPFLIPLEARGKVLRILLKKADGILLAGGGDIDPRFFDEEPHPSLDNVQPERDELELELVRRCLDKKKPLLAICRGMQVMGVATGGSLYQDIASQCPDAQRHHYFHARGYRRDYLAHAVVVEPDSKLAEALNISELRVNSLHHQALKEIPTPSDLRAVAQSPDGIIEGIEAAGHPFAIGVQWHPEELLARQLAAQRLFEAFILACQGV